MTLKQSLLLSLLVIFMSIKNGYAVNPGAFFWRPRLGIDLTMTKELPSPEPNQPTRSNVKKGVVVMIKGYEIGMTLLALVSGASIGTVSTTFNPFSAYFYTNAYRWTLRHLSMLPQVIGGSKTSLETFAVWKRRFYFLDSFIPKFLRKALPYVKEEEWDKEEKEMVEFKKYAESAFGKGFRYPSKTFNDFKSWETEESIDKSDEKKE